MSIEGLNTKLDYALFYTEIGLKIIPVHYVYIENGEKRCSCHRGAQCDSKGKHPALNTYKNFDLDSLTEDQMIEWFSEDGQYHDYNLGALTGQEAGYVVIDTDIRSDVSGEANLKALAAPYGGMSGTLTIKTGTGGFHRYYRHPEGIAPIKSSSGKLAIKVDVRGHNGMAVLPPSIHENGQTYKITFDELSLTELPSWLSERMNSGNTEHKAVLPKVLPKSPEGTANLIPEGRRNDHLTKIAGQLRDQGLSKEQIYAELIKEYHNNCAQSPPMPYEKLEKMAEWVSTKPIRKKAIRKTSDLLLTDAGNAQLFKTKYGDEVRYCRQKKSWLYYDDKKWAEDTKGIITQYALKAIGEARSELLKQVKNKKDRHRIDQFFRSCSNRNKLDNLINLASRNPGLNITITDFDSNPFKINLLDGSYDLLGDSFYGHTKNDFFSTHSPVGFNQYARCELFIQFLETTFCRNKDLIKFIQKALGLCLSGDISEQAIFILYGTGANGKTTLLETISYILGDYAGAANFKTFIETKSNAARNDLARLRDKRLVTAVEANAKAKLDEALIKTVTGGDKIVARFLFKEEFEYYPQFKVFLATNHKPIIGASDYGIVRRIRFVPFNHRYTGDQVDRNILDKLKAEASGVLNWLLEGFRLWKKEGLGYPEIIKESTENYLNSIDIIGNFINDCCVVNKKDMALIASAPNIKELKNVKFNSRCEANLLYKVYSQWAELNGVGKMGSPSLKYTLEERGIHQKRFSAGNYYIGIELQKNVFEKFNSNKKEEIQEKEDNITSGNSFDI